MLKQISKYSFLFDAGGVLYVLIELVWRGWSHWTMFGWSVLYLLGTDQRGIALGNTTVAADLNRSSRHYCSGILDRLHCKFVAWLGRLGLQWHTR